MHSETILIISIFTSLFTSATLWWWLKGSLRNLLGQLCQRGGDTEFWARYTLLMLLIAPLAVVVWFAPDTAQGLQQMLRHLLLTVLLSHFFAFSLVGRTLYRAVAQSAREQQFLPAQGA